MKNKSGEQMYKLLLGELGNSDYWGHNGWAKKKFFEDLGNLEMAISNMRIMWGIDIEWTVKPIEQAKGRFYGTEAAVKEIDEHIANNVHKSK